MPSDNNSAYDEWFEDDTTVLDQLPTVFDRGTRPAPAVTPPSSDHEVTDSEAVNRPSHIRYRSEE